MRTRLIVAFIVVALLAAVATAWVLNLIVPWYPWLGNLVSPPRAAVPPALHGVAEVPPGHPHGGVPPPPGALCLLPDRGRVAAGGDHRPGVRRVPPGAAAGAAAGPGRAADVRRRPVGPDRAAGPRRARPAGHHVQRDGCRAGGQGRRAGADGGTGPAVRRRRLARAADPADRDDRGGRHPPRPPGPDRRRRGRRATGQPGDPPPQPAGARPDRDLPLRRRHRPTGDR